MTPAMDSLPRTISCIKTGRTAARIAVHMETNNILLDMSQRGTLGFMIGRIIDKDNSHDLTYEELGNEPACAVARELY